MRKLHILLLIALIALFCSISICQAGCPADGSGYDGVAWGTLYEDCKDKWKLGSLEKEGKNFHAHFAEIVELGGIPFNAGAIFSQSGKLIAVELVYINDTTDDGHINCRNSVLMDICGECDGLLSATSGHTKFMRWDEGKLRTNIVQDYSTPGMYSLLVRYYKI